jgi:hypothetical protein
MSHGGPSGGFSAAARGNAGAFNGGNAGAFNGGNSFRGDSRMGRMEHGHDRDHDRDGGRFRGSGFAFGFYPGYNYDYDYDYYNSDYGCYQLRQVPTRYGWRWQRVWVCD